MQKAIHRSATALLISFALLFTACATTTLYSKPGTTTTVILLRHADRDEGSYDLNATGVARAKALIPEMRDMGVTAIYSPSIKRNLDTVRPLAKEIDLPITETPAVSVFAAREIVTEILDRHAGGVVVFVGNVSGNLQAVFGYLGGFGIAPVDYGDLCIIRVADQGPPQITRRRFGPETQ
jgi:hypothetical protein